MSVAIDESKCIGCGRCADICPGNLIRMKTKRVAPGENDTESGETEPLKIKQGHSDARAAYLKFPSGCWSCTSCMKECPAAAISLTLPLAAGGRGGKLTAARKRNITVWTVRRPDGSEVKIKTDTAEANRY